MSKPGHCGSCGSDRYGWCKTPNCKGDWVPDPGPRWQILLDAASQGNGVTILELDLEKKKNQPKEGEAS